jgi:uncharacterized OsmC-like protein
MNLSKIDPKKAFKACELSFTKYCSVSKMLEDKSKVSFSVFMNGENTKFEILCCVYYFLIFL